MTSMSKQELISLKEKLLRSTKYYLVDITKIDNQKVEIEAFESFTTLSANIKLYDEEEDRRAVRYLEKSCERLIRLLANQDISYDEVDIEILPLFYLSEAVLKKIDFDYYIDKNEITENDVVNDKVKILLNFNVRENGNYARLPNIVLKCMDDFASSIFLVDYNTFAGMLCEEGYELNQVTFEKVLQARKNGEDIGVNIEFPKEKSIKISK